MRACSQCGFILSPRIVPSFGTYLWNMMDKRLITLLVTSSDFEESCHQDSSSFLTLPGLDPEDLTLSHLGVVLMHFIAGENRTRAAWRELDHATWHYHYLRRWFIAVENLLPPRLQYQEPPYALPEALLAPVIHDDPRDPYVATRDAATAPATDNDDSPTHEETLPSEPQGSSPRGNANEARGQGGAPAVQECTFSGFMKCNPTVFHGHKGAVELSRVSCLTWWNSQVATRGFEAVSVRLDEMKRVKDCDNICLHSGFLELLHYVQKWSDERKKIEAYIRGLTDNIRERYWILTTSLNEVCAWHSIDGSKRLSRTKRIAVRAIKGNWGKFTGECAGNDHRPAEQGGQGPTWHEIARAKLLATDANAAGATMTLLGLWRKRVILRASRPNVVTGTFLLNNHYATVLFDSGSDKSFVNTSFSHLININPVRLDTSYEVEWPMEGSLLGNFDVVIGMDWSVDQDAVIVCGKKVVHIPVKDKTLVVEGGRGMSRLKIISCIKANKYIERGHQLFVAHVTEKEPKEKRLEDVPVIRDFPEVFPDDLPGLPPPRQVEFKIELVPGAAPVARAPFWKITALKRGTQTGYEPLLTPERWSKKRTISDAWRNRLRACIVNLVVVGMTLLVGQFLYNNIQFQDLIANGQKLVRKAYADVSRKPMAFKWVIWFMLRVSLGTGGVIRLGNVGKLSPRIQLDDNLHFIGTVEIMAGSEAGLSKSNFLCQSTMEFQDVWNAMRVLDLETTKTAQAKEIANLKKRVKKLERKRKLRTPGMNLFKIGTSRRRSLGEEDASKHGRNLKQRSIFAESNVDEDLDVVMDEAIEHVYEVDKDVKGDAEQVISATADEVSTSDAVNTAGTKVNTASAPVITTGISVTTAEPITPPTITTDFEDDDLTIAQTLMKMRSEKSKVRGVVMKEPSETATRPMIPPQQHDPKDKAELEEEERLAKQREEDANIIEWDDVQAMMDADYEPAARLQAEEQGELTIK
ncbi:hypothetical protein Tco_0320832 [Tanacetum coccineum]